MSTNKLSSRFASQEFCCNRLCSAEAWVERGRKNILLISDSGKNLMEHFGFLAKEKSWGCRVFRIGLFQLSCQSMIEFPLFGLPIAICLNLSESLRMCFHQKEPIWYFCTVLTKWVQPKESLHDYKIYLETWSEGYNSDFSCQWCLNLLFLICNLCPKQQGRSLSC